nr:putative toxin-antitoxin system toxin component, PIN family [Chamaesiphon sp. OTE_20_metabat_361]
MGYHSSTIVKIVVDTNVFIGAILSSQGLNRELIRRCLLGEYQPMMSNALYLKYESVIEREEIIAKCQLDRSKVNELLDGFLSMSKWVYIYYSWRPNLRDEGDNHVIELAIAGNA